MTSSPSTSLRFSLLAVIFRTVLNKITSRLHLATPTQSTFLRWNQLPPFHFHLFPSFRNTLGQSHEANLRIPCSAKTPQYRVRKRVHEGKPRATNCSRGNQITVQCKVGNWFRVLKLRKIFLSPSLLRGIHPYDHVIKRDVWRNKMMQES